MKVYVAWADEVPPEQGRIIVESLKSVFEVLPLLPTLIELGSSTVVSNWQDACFDLRTKQVDAESLWPPASTWLMQLVWHDERAAIGSRARTVVVCLNRDITTPRSKFVFGVTNELVEQHIQLCVLSTARLDLDRHVDSFGILSRLVRHEFGHAFGLVPESRRESSSAKEELGLGLHCLNPRVMRQGRSLEEFKRLSDEEAKGGILFCEECMTYFLQRESLL